MNFKTFFLDYLKYFLLLLPLPLIWFSIGSNAGNIFEDKNYFELIINFNFFQLREILPHLLCSTFLLLNILNFKNKNHLNVILICMLLIFISQMIGLIFAYYFDFREDFGGGFNFLISLFFYFNYFLYIENSPYEKEKVYNYILFTIIGIFALYTLVIFIKSFPQYLFQPLQFGYGGYEIFLFGEKIVFNSNGISRIFLYLYIFYICLLTFQLNISKKIRGLYYFLLTTIFISIIYYYQSRFAFYSLIIIHIILFFKANIFLKKLILLLSIFFAVFLSHHFNHKMKNFFDDTNNEKIIMALLEKKIINEKILFNNRNKNTHKQQRIFNDEYINSKQDNFDDKNFINMHLSGRIDKIKYTLKYLLKNKEIMLLGSGPEFDRVLFNNTENEFIQKYKTYYEDLASGPFYILLTGGILGFIVYIFLGLLFLKHLGGFIFLKKKQNEYILASLVLTGLVIFMRTAIEKSFLIWSFDAIFLYAYMILLNFKINTKKLKF